MRYSPQSRRAYAALWRNYNDVDIYVEDCSLVGLYERVFNKVLAPSGVKVASVIPLGPKSDVMAEARRLRNDKTRRRLFVVDGDFDWIQKRPRIKDLYMLRCYAFENLAWERRAVAQIAGIFSPDMKAIDIENILTHSVFENGPRMLLPLFVVYLMCSLLDCECVTIGYSVHRLRIDEKSPEVCGVKLKRRIREILVYLRRNFSWLEIRGAKHKASDCLSRHNAFDHRIISGKDYLLQMLLILMQVSFNYRGNVRQLASLLFEHASLNVDPRLRKALLKLAA